MLSKKARYALHALLVLVEHGDGDPMMVADIAERGRVSPHFLEQVLLYMKRCGIVRSKRGRTGGYLLGRMPENISFAEVIRLIDGPLALSPCVSKIAYRKCEDCDDEETCSIRKVLLAARNATAAVLEARTLAGAMPKRRRARTTA
jgi:Rrf2 family protein